tara:strand:- start:29187 stop:30275 length:1089 start_codon:yes stop_codon:yes gene_type:complete
MKYLTSTILVIVLISCSDDPAYYNLDDFNKVDKIDTHIHVSTNRDVFVEQARKDKFKLLNIVVDLSKGREYVESQYAYRLNQKKRHPRDFEIATAFSINEWDDPNWLDITLAWLEKNIDEGAIAVKIWKNVGMVFKDSTGQLVMVDNPKLDTIFKYLTERRIPVVGHLGEPKNCWLPLEEMSVNNDKVYFEEHPQYHMHKHPELPSYEDQIAARDRMLEKNPDLIFVGAHMGSLEWSVDELAKRLDKFPNMSVDLAARIGQVFSQTIENREKVRDFFIKYQDRILYATDLADGGKNDPQILKKEMHETWLLDWQFFVTDDIMKSDRVNEEFRGLKLPRAVVDKIYNGNAKNWLKMFPNEKME